MKVAISNIAWQPDEEAAVAGEMQRLGLRGVEIAPTKLWSKPLEVSETEARRYRESWERRGIPIVAMQSLLFGRPDLALFETEAKRREMLDYLKGILRLGAWLGAGIAVFGSPKNRRRGALAWDQALAVAKDFFAGVGEAAENAGLCFCIEPNPAAYDCDFVTTSAEGRALVQAVNRPGFGLHLDAAALTLSRELPSTAVQASPPPRHFHASEVQLAPVGSGSVEHKAFAEALRKIKYAGWVSIEMRARERDNVPAVVSALQFVLNTY